MQNEMNRVLAREYNRRRKPGADKALADEVGVTEVAIYRWRKGDMNFSVAHIEAIAKSVIGVSYTELMTVYLEAYNDPR